MLTREQIEVWRERLIIDYRDESNLADKDAVVYEVMALCDMALKSLEREPERDAREAVIKAAREFVAAERGSMEERESVDKLVIAVAALDALTGGPQDG